MIAALPRFIKTPPGKPRTTLGSLRICTFLGRQCELGIDVDEWVCGTLRDIAKGSKEQEREPSHDADKVSEEEKRIKEEKKHWTGSVSLSVHSLDRPCQSPVLLRQLSRLNDRTVAISHLRFAAAANATELLRCATRYSEYQAGPYDELFLTCVGSVGSHIKKKEIKKSG